MVCRGTRQQSYGPPHLPVVVTGCGAVHQYGTSRAAEPVAEGLSASPKRAREQVAAVSPAPPCHANTQKDAWSSIPVSPDSSVPSGPDPVRWWTQGYAA